MDGVVGRAGAVTLGTVVWLTRGPGWVEAFVVQGVTTRLARGVYRLGSNLRHAQVGYVGAIAWTVALGLAGVAIAVLATMK